MSVKIKMLMKTKKYIKKARPGQSQSQTNAMLRALEQVRKNTADKFPISQESSQ
jgi:hypothetical protein